MPCTTPDRRFPCTTGSYAGYNQFAWLYDQEWGCIGSALYAVIDRVTGKLIPPRANILDLCCGTGRLARVLTESGYQVTGLDGSAAMLALAKKNAPAAQFILADARRFRLPPVFQAVFSTFDSLNHLMTSKCLRAAFENVFICLAPGGVFAFDLNTLTGYQTQWQDYQEVVDQGSFFYVNRGYYHASRHTGETRCTIFRRRQGTWQRTDIRLSQKYHPPDRVVALLQRVGFVRVRQYGVSQKQALHKFTTADTRVFFVCRKP
jgi:SAM-dependent methyltransferase